MSQFETITPQPFVQFHRYKAVGRKFVFAYIVVLALLTGCVPFDKQSLIRTILLKAEATPEPTWSLYVSGVNNNSGILGQQLVFNATVRTKGNFAIHPVTNDIFFFDRELGLLRQSSITGLVDIFLPAINQPSGTLTYTALNLPENGEVLPSTAGTIATWGQVEFDNNGKLYLNIQPTPQASDINLTSFRIYQIDVDQRTSKLYLGGGLSSATTALPLEISLGSGPTAFDESNSLYFYTPCSVNTPSTVMKLMKVTQTASGNAGTISHIAGNCTAAAPTNGASATVSGIGNAANAAYDSLVVWNNGATIYFNQFSLTGTYKILADGRIYTTSLPNTNGDRGIAYNPVSGKILIVDNSGAIREFTPSLVGAAGEVESPTYFARTDGSGLCHADNVDALNSCTFASLAIRVRGDGTVLFQDGLRVNVAGIPRIRYKDSNNKLQTLIGAPSFSGHLDNRQNARAYTGGVYYKQSSEPNQAAFPAGLYFTDYHGMVFARVDEVTDVVENIWGSQGPGFSALHASGTAVSPALRMGVGYASNGMAFTFDREGLPWIRYNRNLVSLTASRTIFARQTLQTAWDSVAVSATVSNSGLSVDGGLENFNIKDQSLFLMGRFSGDAPFLRLFDFRNNVNRHLMGGVSGTIAAFDSVVPGSLESSAISTNCMRSRCSIQFFEGSTNTTEDDILYFAEGRSLRAIVDPTTPANNFLYTLFTSPHLPVSGTFSQINNFTVSPDHTKVFYLLDNYDPQNPIRNLYCQQLIDTGDSWCNDSNPLKLPSSLPKLPQTRIANQFTWKDNKTLFFSIGYYGIYKIDLP